MADFNYFLNRQGVRGLQGVKGDQGDSPIITVQTETPNEYILKITNPDGTELISPNLRGNKININEGTYVRYNTETGELYTSTADGATGELAGVVRLATDADITDMDEKAAVTPSQLADALSKYLVSPDGSVKIVQNTENSLTELTVEGTSPTDLPIATATTLGGVKVGDNLSITEDGTLSASSEAKTVKTPSGRIKLDDAGLHNQDNSRPIINRSEDRQEVTVGNGYEPTIIDGSSIKLNSTNITDRDGNTFLSGDTIKGVKFFQDSAANKNVANSGHTNNRLELTANACNLYDSDNRQVFGSSYNSGIGKTDWSFASQSDTVRIANKSASTSYGLMLKVPSDGTSPTIGYTYYGTDSSLYGKEQTFLRTEDVDNSTIKIVNGKLTASGGGSAPTNMVTTDTTQSISGQKTFSSRVTVGTGTNLTRVDGGSLTLLRDGYSLDISSGLIYSTANQLRFTSDPTKGTYGGFQFENLSTNTMLRGMVYNQNSTNYYIFHTGNLIGSDNITISNPTDTVAAKINISQALLDRITALEATVASLQTQIGEISAKLDEINGEEI